MNTNWLFALFSIVGMGVTLFALGWVLASAVFWVLRKLVAFLVNRTAELANKRMVAREWDGQKYWGTCDDKN